MRCSIVTRERCFRQFAVCTCFQVLVLHTTGQCSVVVVALVQIEAVQIIGNLTVVELCLCHRGGNASTIVGGIVVLSTWIVTVHYLRTFAVSRIAKDGTNATIGSTRGINPTVLYIAITRINDTS